MRRHLRHVMRYLRRYAAIAFRFFCRYIPLFDYYADAFAGAIAATLPIADATLIHTLIAGRDATPLCACYATPAMLLPSYATLRHAADADAELPRCRHADSHIAYIAMPLLSRLMLLMLPRHALILPYALDGYCRLPPCRQLRCFRAAAMPRRDVFMSARYALPYALCDNLRYAIIYFVCAYYAIVILFCHMISLAA